VPSVDLHECLFAPHAQAQSPTNAAAAAAAAARLRKLTSVRRKMQGWTPGPGDFVLTTDVIDVINE